MPFFPLDPSFGLCVPFLLPSCPLPHLSPQGYPAGGQAGKDTLQLVLLVLGAQAGQVCLVAVQAPWIAGALGLVLLSLFPLQSGHRGVEAELGSQERCSPAAIEREAVRVAEALPRGTIPGGVGAASEGPSSLEAQGRDSRWSVPCQESRDMSPAAPSLLPSMPGSPSAKGR